MGMRLKGGAEVGRRSRRHQARTDMERSSKLCRGLVFAGRVVHFLIALAFVFAAVAEFSVEPPFFDVLRHYNQRSELPDGVFQNVSGNTGNWDTRRVMDLPILFLFLVYFLTVFWLKCWGVWAWLLTGTMVGLLLAFLTANQWAEPHFQWSYLSTRAVSILVSVLTLAFAWSMVAVTLLNIKNWFPFKIKKFPTGACAERFGQLLWNFCALFLVLTFCLVVWFSRLYTSWACARSQAEILLLCQFTNQVQCWPCQNAETCSGLDKCVHPLGNAQPFHCLSPIYSLPRPVPAFCVFNYNIGIFTFIIVFAYVGGIYFFLHTTLNSLVKCVCIVGAIVAKYVHRLAHRRLVTGELSAMEEGGPGRRRRDRVSLLVSLPTAYCSTNSD